MSFINRSVGFSETNRLKQNLIVILKQINESNKLTNIQIKNITEKKKHIIIPNNNKLYYMFIAKCPETDNNKSCHNIIYFFPYNSETGNFNKFLSKKEKYTSSDFFIEIDNKFNSNLPILFSGYLYKSDSHQNKSNFLITDMLYKNGVITSSYDYETRFSLINEFLIDNEIYLQSLKNLNNHLDIGIHPIFTDEQQDLVDIFINNFVFSNQINYIEKSKYTGFEKTNIEISEDVNFKKHKNLLDTVQKKIIKVTNLPDVYEVFSHTNGSYNGILYVKTLQESLYLKNIFKKNPTTETIVENCCFDSNFNKWKLAEL